MMSPDSPIFSRIIKKAIRLRLYSRRFHAFGVGAPKSGTTSIASMLEAQYRSLHEPDAEETIENILLNAQGSLSRETLTRYVASQDSARRLEMNSSSFNVHLLPCLLQLFPHSKYILTIRDCYSWLDSLLGHVTFRTTSSTWERFRAFRFGRSARYHKEEKDLKEKGFFPLDGYLGYWSWHNQYVLDTVPPERLLVLRTDEISTRIDEIACFLGVDASSIQISRSRGNIAHQKGDFVSSLPSRFLVERASEHCAALMDKYYPGKLQGIDARLAEDPTINRRTSCP